MRGCVLDTYRCPDGHETTAYAGMMTMNCPKVVEWVDDKQEGRRAQICGKSATPIARAAPSPG